MNQTNLQKGSHSHATVSLVLDGDSTCVLKRSSLEDSRFAESISKQSNFTAIALGGMSITSAQILKQESSNNQLAVYMRYIHGITGEDFALNGDKFIAIEISRALSALMLDNMAKSEIREVSTQVFLSKILQVIDATGHKNLQSLLIKVSDTVHLILSDSKTINIPIGPCHGDLTLSNVIWNPSTGLVLIDFLSTFLESPLQDLAKISQELEFGWSFRRLDQNLQIKSKLFCNLAYPSYARYLYTLFPDAAYLFKILCLARIAPYINDEVSAEWLTRSLNNVIDHSPIKIPSSIQ
jgi:hypothetical protein